VIDWICAASLYTTVHPCTVLTCCCVVFLCCHSMAAREVVDNQKLVVSCSEWLLQHIENKDAHCADLQKR
jgi:hemerythrin